MRKTRVSTIAGLRRAAKHCHACPLWKPATQTVFGKGPDDASIVLIGEQAGDREDIEGEPFVGPAGRLLDQALDEAGIDRGALYVTNDCTSVRTRPRSTRACAGSMASSRRSSRATSSASARWRRA